MKIRCSVTLLSLLLVTSGCGSPRLDTSSDEKLKASIQTVKNSLSAEDKKEFEDSIKILAFDGVNSIFDLSADPGGMERKLKEKLDGKSAKEVIAEGKRILAERREKQRKEIEGEIQELLTKQVNSKKAAKSLAAFSVERSRFYYSKDRFSSGPTIELTVKNGTPHPVSRVYFHGVLATPGRAVPWVEDDFNYSISGGLEPGESATWNLSPNQFGEWGRAPRERNDMVLTVTVVRIDGANEKGVLDAEFSKSDQERLDSLKKKLAEF